MEVHRWIMDPQTWSLKAQKYPICGLSYTLLTLSSMTYLRLTQVNYCSLPQVNNLRLGKWITYGSTNEL